MLYEVYIAVSPSNTYYVGITSQGFETRKRQHYTKAFSNKLMTPFYQALRKYDTNMQWSVLVGGLTKSEACVIEKQYIKKFKETFDVYNVTPGGELPWNTGTVGVCKRTKASILKQQESRKNYSHSSLTKEKIGNAHRGKTPPKSFYINWAKARNIQKFEAFSPEGVSLGIYSNRTQFARMYNLSAAKISACLTGKRPHHKNYTFKLIQVGE